DIVGNAGDDSLFLDDSGDTTADTGIALAGVLFTGNYVEGLVDADLNRRVTYSDVENVTISTSTMDDIIDLDDVSNGDVTLATLNSLLGSDEFQVTTNMNTDVLINAGDPTPPTVPGDHLIVTTVNVDTPIVFPALTNSTFNTFVATVPNQPIRWTSMESFTFDMQPFIVGDIFVRGTDDGDRIVFSLGNNGKTVVRVDDTFYGQHLVTGKIVVYGEDGEDRISIAGNLSIPGEMHGGPMADYIAGSRLNDTMFGDDGNDILIAGTGDDTIDGGLGNDEISADEGNDLVFGGTDTGNDKILLGSGNDTAFGGDGNDNISGQDGDDILFGEAGNDILSGSRGNDILSGQAGDDKLFGDTGFDILLGGDDADKLYGQFDDDIMLGGISTDEANIAALQAVLAIWSDTGTYPTVLDRIGAMPAGFAAPGPDAPLTDIDEMLGSLGGNWFIVHSEDIVGDFDAGDDVITSL
ncbi:MAG: Ca2+-binding RTX toxin-like protein, partial [Pirellulaceae bacterium]